MSGEAETARFEDAHEDHPLIEHHTGFHGWVWNIGVDLIDYHGTPIRREYVEHTSAVAILALDEDDRALFIRQYRHPARTRDWELPAGLLDAEGEAPLDAARRELAEEADLAADEWAVLLDFWTSPGGSNESIRIYLARGLHARAPFAREAEEADITTAWVPLNDALEAALGHRIHNPAALQAIFAANESRRRDWATLLPATAPWPTRSPRPDPLPRALQDGRNEHPDGLGA